MNPCRDKFSMPYCHLGFKVHPLDSAVYHTEYVMRHKGAPFLQQQYGANLSWLQGPIV